MHATIQTAAGDGNINTVDSHGITRKYLGFERMLFCIVRIIMHLSIEKRFINRERSQHYRSKDICTRVELFS